MKRTPQFAQSFVLRTLVIFTLSASGIGCSKMAHNYSRVSSRQTLAGDTLRQSQDLHEEHLTLTDDIIEPIHPHYDLIVSREEAREVLLRLLEINQAVDGKVPAGLESVARKLLHSYRSDSKIRPGMMTIENAPFLGTALLSSKAQLDKKFSDEFRTNKEKEFESNVGRLKIEDVYNVLLEDYVLKFVEYKKAVKKNPKLEDPIYRAFAKSPEDEKLKNHKRVEDAANDLGECLLRRVIEAKSQSCDMDETRTVRKRPVVELAMAKLGCALKLPFPSPCDTRRAVFDYAKKDLLNLRFEVAPAQFAREYPEKFRECFLYGCYDEQTGKHDDEMSSFRKMVRTFSDLVNTKFSGTKSSLWNGSTPLVESDEAHPERMSLREFAAGVRADLRTAAALATSAEPRDRGDAAALFYAAGNRMLLLTGAKEFARDEYGTSFKVVSPFDLAHPDAPPIFAEQDFGGWSLGAGPAFSNWDWAGYDPNIGYRIFPTAFDVNNRGVPQLNGNTAAEQTLGDLAVLAQAAMDFLVLTRPGSVLSKHLGDSADNVFDEKSPVLFPTLGRKIAVAVLATVLRNIQAKGVGHIEKIEGSPLVKFINRVGTAGRLEGATPTRSAARLLLVAADLRTSIEGDADVPAELAANLSDIDSALQVGALTLQTSQPEGAYDEFLGEANHDQQHKMATTVTALRVTNRAYAANSRQIFSVSLIAGWKYLEQAWSSERHISPSDAWELLKLWKETQSYTRAKLEGQVDWSRWDQRFDALSKVLHEQFASAQGPMPLTQLP